MEPKLLSSCNMAVYFSIRVFQCCFSIELAHVHSHNCVRVMKYHHHYDFWIAVTTLVHWEIENICFMVKLIGQVFRPFEFLHLIPLADSTYNPLIDINKFHFSFFFLLFLFMDAIFALYSSILYCSLNQSFVCSDCLQ